MFDDDFTKWFTYKYGIVCIIFLLVLSKASVLDILELKYLLLIL